VPKRKAPEVIPINLNSLEIFHGPYLPLDIDRSEIIRHGESFGQTSTLDEFLKNEVEGRELSDMDLQALWQYEMQYCTREEGMVLSTPEPILEQLGLLGDNIMNAASKIVELADHPDIIAFLVDKSYDSWSQ
jgi:hypothetical protein